MHPLLLLCLRKVLQKLEFTEPCGAVCSLPDFGTVRLLVRICICLCSECGVKNILAVQHLWIPFSQVVRQGHMLTHSTIQCIQEVKMACMCILTDHSTRGFHGSI
jgi:hypothetical protein